jgi:hypothetical protein
VTLDKLSDRSVADIVKKRLEAAGFDPTVFSGHSLRAGFITAAGDVSWVRVFGSGASLAHRPEKRQQMDLIKPLDFGSIVRIAYCCLESNRAARSSQTPSSAFGRDSIFLAGIRGGAP